MSRLDPISQYSSSNIGIAIVEGNTPTDADGNAVTVTITRDLDSVEVVSAQSATHDIAAGIAGLYYYTLPLSAVTATKGSYTAVWDWLVGGDARTFSYQFEVVDTMPFFDSLNAEQKSLVDNIYHRVSDGFDSTIGGPYLWELPQSTFNYETVAHLMVIDAMNLINYTGPKAFIPPFEIGASVGRPIPSGWYGLVEKAASYELYKHLARSYLEIPFPNGVNVAYLDRTSYHQKWMDMAQFEKQELDSMIKMLKREMRFGVKSRSLLLAGGIFPISYLNPARPRWPYVLTRFY